MEAVDAVRGEELFQDFGLRGAALLPRLPRPCTAAGGST